MSRPASLTANASGVYTRQIGYTSTSSQPRFMLGKDKEQAFVRAALLERLWGMSKEDARLSGGDPKWDRFTLALGRAIANGKEEFAATPELVGGEGDVDFYRAEVSRLAKKYGHIIRITTVLKESQPEPTSSRLLRLAFSYSSPRRGEGNESFWKDFKKFCRDRKVVADDFDVLYVLVRHFQSVDNDLIHSDVYMKLFNGEDESLTGAV